MEINRECAIDKIKDAKKIWLFLDYDGTLADFAPTPDIIIPNREVIELISRLKIYPRYSVSIISGRRLDHIKDLLPVDGILLAGSYGVEMQMPNGERRNRLEYSEIRPSLERIKQQWQMIIPDDPGFFLEDKGWTLAIHARHAENTEAVEVLRKGKQIALQLNEDPRFQILGGYKFLEIAPVEANKGKTIHYLLDLIDMESALPIYVGDDDKDEAAFKAINERDGISILVSKEPRNTHAALHLEDPASARAWLEAILDENDRGDELFL